MCDSVVRAVGRVLAFSVLLVACQPSGDATLYASHSATARYRVTDSAYENVVLRGVADFAKGFERYSMYRDGSFVGERIMVGRAEIERAHGREEWVKVENALAPVSTASVALRHAILDPTRSIPFLRSVASEVRQVGTESIRGKATTHYVATVDLARVGSPESRIVDVELWVAKNGTVRRFRDRPLGREGERVWDFTDFGVAVDTSLPPARTIS